MLWVFRNTNKIQFSRGLGILGLQKKQKRNKTNNTISHQRSLNLGLPQKEFWNIFFVFVVFLFYFVFHIFLVPLSGGPAASFSFADVALLAVCSLSASNQCRPKKSRHCLPDPRCYFHSLLDRSRISYLLANFLIALVRLGCFPLLGDDGPDIVALLLFKCLVVLGCQEEEKFVPIHPHLIQHWPITTKPAERLFTDTKTLSFFVWTVSFLKVSLILLA